MRMWKIFISSLLVVLCLSAAFAFAEQESISGSGSCGENVYWELDDSGVLTISGSGPMTDYSFAENSPWYENRSLIQTIIIEDDVSYISNHAFNECAVTYIELPQSLQEIGAHAFLNCSELASVSFPENLSSLGIYAFSGCTSLTEVSLPVKMNTIGMDAFSYCTSLKSVKLPSSLTEISSSLFTDCSSLLAIEIPEGVTRIGSSAFSGCSNLRFAVIPDSVQDIDINAFRSLYSMTAYVNHNDYACEFFAGGGISVVSPIAYGKCGDTLYWRITQEDDAACALSIVGSGDMADYANSGEPPWYDYRSSISSVTLDAEITGIGAYAFADCTALQGSFSMPEGITRIGDGAFSGSAISRIDIPASVKKIGANPFYGCENLKIYVETGSDAVDWCDNNEIDCIVKVLSDINNKWLLHGRDNLYTLTYSNTNAISEYVNENSPLWPYVPYIKTLVLEEGIARIANNIFASCSFDTIYIPASITLIADGAFGENPAASNVYYSGTFFEAASIPGAFLPNATWHCSDYTVPGKMGTSYSNESGKYAWALSADGEFIVRGTGELKYIQSDAVYADIGGGITSLAESLFSGHEKLQTVVLDAQVKELGDYAFNNCTALTSISMPDGGLTSIGSCAFNGCTALESCIIPESVQSFGSSVFAGCTALKSLILSASPESFHWGLMGTTCITSAGPIGSGCDFQFAWTDRIPEHAFYRCLGLKEVIIPETVTELGIEAFRNCSALETVQLPDGLEVLPEHIFWDCVSLKDFELPSGLTGIETGAFSGCTSLVSMTIPKNVTSLGEGVFLYATSMTDVYLPDGIIECGDENIAFNDYTFVYHYPANSQTAQTLKGTFFISPSLEDFRLYIGDNGLYLHNYSGSEANIVLPDTVDGMPVIGLWDTFDGNKSLLSVVIPDSVKYIDSYSFNMCGNLEEVVMSKNLELLGTNAFAFCHKLKAIDLPDTLTFIGYGALQLCNSMTELILPDSVETLDAYALNFCDKLETLHLPANLKTIGESAFSNCSSLKEITIPDGVTKLNASLFNSCHELKDLYLPDNITEIDPNAFSVYTGQVVSIENIYYRLGTKTMYSMFRFGVNVFRSLTNPDWGIHLIEQEAEKILALLNNYFGMEESVLVPAFIDGVDIAGTLNTFKGNTTIKEVLFSEGIQAIDFGSFSGCSSLSSIQLPESLTAIETDAFSGCSSLSELLIPQSVNYIGGSTETFDTCAEDFVLHVYLDSPAESWCVDNSMPHESECVEHVPFNVPDISPTCTESGISGVVTCSVCEETLSEGEVAPALGHSEEILAAVPATHVTTGLTEGSRCSTCGRVSLAQNIIPLVDVPIISLPESLSVIRNQAFANSAIQCIVIPQGCQSIEALAFENSSQLLFVEIPSSVTKIDKTAFENCSSEMIIVTSASSFAEAFARQHSIRCVIK